MNMDKILIAVMLAVTVAYILFINYQLTVEAVGI
jgi:hypothetical protein